VICEFLFRPVPSGFALMSFKEYGRHWWGHIAGFFPFDIPAKHALPPVAEGEKIVAAPRTSSIGLLGLRTWCSAVATEAVLTLRARTLLSAYVYYGLAAERRPGSF
jgi:hypothetical protein